MDINAAKTAVPLVAAIDQLNDLVAKLQSGNYKISTLRAADETGSEMNLLVGPLTADQNTAAINFVISIYQSQLTAANAALAAL